MEFFIFYGMTLIIKFILQRKNTHKKSALSKLIERALSIYFITYFKKSAD